MKFDKRYKVEQQVVGTRLRELRENMYGESQATIADKLHVLQPTYARYETGQNRLMPDVVTSLSKLYNVPEDYLDPKKLTLHHLPIEIVNLLYDKSLKNEIVVRLKDLVEKHKNKPPKRLEPKELKELDDVTKFLQNNL